MKKANFIVFDLETGGVEPTENPILEVAMVGIDAVTLKEIHRLEFLIKPYDDLEITKKALSVNGLKIADLEENGLSKKDAFKKIVSFLKSMNPNGRKENKPILVGHNVVFDIEFLIVFFYMNNESDLYEYVSRHFSCTMLEMKKLGKTPTLGLKECCDYFNIKLNNAHKAMPDTLATVDLFKALTLSLRGNSDSVEIQSQKTTKKRVRFHF